MLLPRSGSAPSNRKALAMRCSHCTGAHRSRLSHTRSYARLLLETLEARTVLSAAGALAASLASAGSSTAPLIAEVGEDSSEDAAAPSLRAAPPAVARPTPVPWVAGLRVALASSTLRPRNGGPGGEQLERQASTLSLTATSSSTIDPRLQDLSPTSKYCRKYSLTLCNVSLDDSVDPIYSCPNIEDLFCLP